VLSTIAAALIAFLSSIYVTRLNNNSLVDLEQKKLESNLIIEAGKIGINDRRTALENLSWWLEAGFIKDPERKIRR